jgi:site-specific recombinase XerD
MSCRTPRPSLAIAAGADVEVVQQMLDHAWQR